MSRSDLGRTLTCGSVVLAIALAVAASGGKGVLSYTQHDLNCTPAKCKINKERMRKKECESMLCSRQCCSSTAVMNALSNESPAPRRAETGNDDGAAR